MKILLVIAGLLLPMAAIAQTGITFPSFEEIRKSSLRSKDLFSTDKYQAGLASCNQGEYPRFYPTGGNFPKHCFEYFGASEMSPERDSLKDGGRLVYLKFNEQGSFPVVDSLLQSTKETSANLMSECSRLKEIIESQYGGFTPGIPGANQSDKIVSFYMPPEGMDSSPGLNLHLLPRNSGSGIGFVEPYVSGKSSQTGLLEVPSLVASGDKSGSFKYACPTNVASEVKDVVPSFKVSKVSRPQGTRNSPSENAFNQEMLNRLSLNPSNFKSYMNSCGQTDPQNQINLRPPVLSFEKSYTMTAKVVESYRLVSPSKENMGEIQFTNSRVLSKPGEAKISIVEGLSTAEKSPRLYRVKELPGHTAAKPNLEIVRLDDETVERIRALKEKFEDPKQLKQIISTLKGNSENTFEVHRPAVTRAADTAYLLGFEKQTGRCHLFEGKPSSPPREIQVQSCDQAENSAIVVAKSYDWFFDRPIARSWRMCDLQSKSCGQVFANFSSAYQFEQRPTEDTSHIIGRSSQFVGPCTIAASPKNIFPPRRPFESDPRLPASVTGKAAQ
jgi:hypothetical protein